MRAVGVAGLLEKGGPGVGGVSGGEWVSGHKSGLRHREVPGREPQGQTTLTMAPELRTDIQPDPLTVTPDPRTEVQPELGG